MTTMDTISSHRELSSVAEECRTFRDQLVNPRHVYQIACDDLPGDHTIGYCV
jgi:hypothetical protein